MATAVVLRHVHFEDLGTLAPLLAERGLAVRYLDPALDALAPAPAADLLVVLGGPIGAFDEDRYPFLANELALVRQRLAARTPILGVCLGAQLMARALGATVAPMARKEIGFAPLTQVRGVLAPLAGVPVLHWHGDRFALPIDALPLAASAACAEQAFAVGTYALALQFHLEADTGCIERWLVGHACELAQAGVDPRALRAAAARHGAQLAHAARQVLGAWLDQAGLQVRGGAAVECR